MKRSKSLYVAAGAALMLLVLAAFVVLAPWQHRLQVGLQSVSLGGSSPETASPASASASGLSPKEVAFVQGPLDLLSLPSARQTPESLTKTQALKRMGRLYRYQASLLDAQAEGDEAQVGHVLDQAMRELQTLARQPDLWKQPRFQRLYDHLAETYRAHYGAPDTLRAVRGDIFPARDSLFAAVEAEATRAAVGLSDAPLLDEASAEALQPEATEVPLPVNTLTRAALRYLQKEPEDHVYRWMRRKETYFPMIEHIFAEEGVPDELKYLSMVESGLNPQAESWASAAGIWQFIPATARAYGLKITPWVDERMDPEKATRAAARHLKDLYRMFGGDWHLALSGYNCSPTRIRQAMRTLRQQGRQPTFWNIYPHIPRETRNYVPTFVAASLMLSNPGHFDLERVQPGPRYRFDRVPVRGMLPLETVAELAGTSVEQVRALNPSLRRGTLPPSAQPFQLRLPYGTYERFVNGYRALPDSAKGLTLAHRVRAGETLGGVAERYGVPPKALQEANELDGRTITAGDSLVVPVASYATGGGLLAGADASADEGDRPQRVQYSSRALRPLAVAEGDALPGQQKQATGGGAITEDVTTYRVRRGDTLYGIARRYDVSVADLQRWNDLRSTAGLQPGQTLTVRS